MTSDVTPAEPDAPVRSDPAPGDIDSLGVRERLRWFGTFWVMAMVFHHTDTDATEAGAVLVCALPLLIWPTSGLAFGLFLVAATAFAVDALPGPANHTMLAGLVGLAFGVAALWLVVGRLRAGVRTSGGGDPGASEAGDPEAGSGAGDPATGSSRARFIGRLFEVSRTPIGLTLLVVYGFAVFHKLNTAFFDPANSCAAKLMRGLFETNNLVAPPLSPTVVLGAAIGTVVVETVITVLIAVPRLRIWGLALGVGFHCVLAPASFFDFATTVYALYLLLVPNRVFAAVASRSDTLRYWALTAFGVHVMISITASLMGSGGTTFGLPWHTVRVVTFYLAVLPFLLTLLRAGLADHRARRGPWPGWRIRPVVLLLVPLLAFLNGMAPYLGLKTVSSYSMFSNLHTEGGNTNHLIPAVNSGQIWHYQRDLVTVTELRVPQDVTLSWTDWMDEKPPVVIPWLELRETALWWREDGVSGVRLTIVHNGVTRTIADAAADPELTAPLPWWQRKLLAFRVVHSGSGADICRW